MATFCSITIGVVNGYYCYTSFLIPTTNITLIQFSIFTIIFKFFIMTSYYQLLRSDCIIGAPVPALIYFVYKLFLTEIIKDPFTV